MMTSASVQPRLQALFCLPASGCRWQQVAQTQRATPYAVIAATPFACPCPSCCSNGVVYVSSAEHKRYPFTATQVGRVKGVT